MDCIAAVMPTPTPTHVLQINDGRYIPQPLQVGEYKASGKSVTKSVNLSLEHFLNNLFLLCQFFLGLQVHTLVIFLTKKNSTKIGEET